MQKADGVEPVGEKPPSLGMGNDPQWNALHRQLIMPAPAGEHAAWEGWGTALKPAHEVWWLARKPLEGTVVENVRKWGVGALNLDACSIPNPTPGKQDRSDEPSVTARSDDTTTNFSPTGGPRGGSEDGRWPPNVLVSHTDECYEGYCNAACPTLAIEAQGGKAVFFPAFYCAKPSRREKERGCAHLPVKTAEELTGRKAASAGLVMKHTDGSAEANPYAGTSGAVPRRNHHPTIKATALMEWLCQLITPRGGIVLDMFGGSGSTGLGALAGGFRCILIEKDDDQGYVDIARARLRWISPETDEEIEAFGEPVLVAAPVDPACDF